MAGRQMRGIERYQIRKIYAMGSGLGIVGHGREDELHTLVAGMTGRSSIKELTYPEAAEVITRLEELQGSAAPARPSGKGRREPAEERPGGVTAGQQKKIWALMYELKKYDRTPADIPLGDRLCAVIKKELHVDALARKPFVWLTFKQGNNLIEILKGYVRNEERKAVDEHGPAE